MHLTRQKTVSRRKRMYTVTDEAFNKLKEELTGLALKWAYMLADRILLDRDIPKYYKAKMTHTKISRVFSGHTKDPYLRVVVYRAGEKMKEDLTQEILIEGK